MPVSKNIKIFLNYWLGPVIFLWLSWSIYRQVMTQPDLPHAWQQIKNTFSGDDSFWFVFSMALVPVNWGLEALKWRELLHSLQPVSVWRAFKATLAGVAFAVNTPNRIGEYAGRVLYLPEGKRLEAVSLTLVGSYSQLLVTLFAGTAGLWLFHSGALGLSLPHYWETNNTWVRVLATLLTSLSVLFLLIYLRISWLVQLVEKMPGAGKLSRLLTVIDHLPVRILLRVLGWSFLRYVVFLFQYILLLHCFGVTGSAWLLSWQAAWLVAIQFLVLAIIPTIALAEIGIRGTLALELFGWISTNPLAIISASVTIWLVNLVLPAVAGSLLIIRIKVFDPVKRNVGKTALPEQKEN